MQELMDHTIFLIFGDYFSLGATIAIHSSIPLRALELMS